MIYVCMFSDFHVFKECKKGGGKSHKHIISLSRANKTDHQHKLTHTHRCWRRHITPFSEDRNTFRLGARGDGGSSTCGDLPREMERVLCLPGAVSCAPLDGTRAFSCGLKGSESATLNRSRRATAFSRASLSRPFLHLHRSLAF